MTLNKLISDSKLSKSMRLFPGIILALLQWILWFLVPIFSAGGTAMAISVFGGLASGLFILIWWLFFSRSKWLDRWIALVTIIVSLVVFPFFAHESIVTGLSGLMFYVYAFPVITISFVVWAVVSRFISDKFKRITMVLTILIAGGIWTLVRSDSLSGNASAQLAWRWAKTNEEKLLAQSDDNLSAYLLATTESDYEWSGFRGPNRDGVVHGVKIETDWKKEPPVEMWRRAIGPGCSSFSVRGELVFTQEQRGENEIVSCYNLKTGEPIWRHQDEARFWDSHAGAGPRGTPTLKDSLVYSLGATGILNVLNISDGSLVWSRDAAKDIKLQLPGWGIASSPLVIEDVVIVAVSGTVIAYDIVSSEIRWQSADGGENYSSPHLVTIDGIQQVLVMNQKTAISFLPSDGKILWEYPKGGGSIVQPAVTANGDLLLSQGYKKGIHRVTVSNKSEEWNIKEHWMTTKIRPDFNDFVIHNEYLYGFEGLSLTCVDLKDGSRKWKHGRFGGQVILIADQDILIVLSEKGELILIKASTDKYTELGKIRAIEGKTWNHHILVDDIILVRNIQEMVAYKLTLLE